MGESKARRPVSPCTFPPPLECSMHDNKTISKRRVRGSSIGYCLYRGAGCKNGCDYSYKVHHATVISMVAAHAGQGMAWLPGP